MHLCKFWKDCIMFYFVWKDIFWGVDLYWFMRRASQTMEKTRMKDCNKEIWGKKCIDGHLQIVRRLSHMDACQGRWQRRWAIFENWPFPRHLSVCSVGSFKKSLWWQGRRLLLGSILPPSSHQCWNWLGYYYSWVPNIPAVATNSCVLIVPSALEHQTTI